MVLFYEHHCFLLLCLLYNAEQSVSIRKIINIFVYLHKGSHKSRRILKAIRMANLSSSSLIDIPKICSILLNL